MKFICFCRNVGHVVTLFCIALLINACSEPVERPGTIPVNAKSLSVDELSNDFLLGSSIEEIIKLLEARGFEYTGPYSASYALPTDLPQGAKWVLEVQTAEGTALCNRQDTTLFVFDGNESLIDLWTEGSISCS